MLALRTRSLGDAFLEGIDLQVGNNAGPPGLECRIQGNTPSNWWPLVRTAPKTSSSRVRCGPPGLQILDCLGRSLTMLFPEGGSICLRRRPHCGAVWYSRLSALVHQ